MLRLWLLAIFVYVGAFAPSRADARGAETCAQGFLAMATTARPESEPQVAGLHQGFAACGYELASGYPQGAETRRDPEEMIQTGYLCVSASLREIIRSLSVRRSHRQAQLKTSPV